MPDDIILQDLTCQRCGHRWIPRVPRVRQCPKCRSVYWDTPRQREFSKKGDKDKKDE